MSSEVIEYEEFDSALTPTQNLYEYLDVNKDSSYESLILKLKNEFSFGT